MITLGLRLADAGSAWLSWRDLWVIIRNTRPDSALSLAVNGPKASWSTTHYLLAAVVDLLAGANWQRQGKPNAQKPKPLPRPGQEEGTRVGSDPLPITELDAWIAEQEAKAA